MTSKTKSLLLGAFAVACLPSFALAASVGEWNVRLDLGSLLRAGGGPTAARSWLTQGKAQLFRSSEGKYSFRVLGESVDECFQSESDAEVIQTAATMTIIPEGRFRTCPKIRVVIKNDGTGGHVEALVGRKANATWAVDDDHDYDLTPR